MNISFEMPETWVAIAFIIFLILSGKKVWKLITSLLDKKIAEIKKELSESHRLSNEAQAILNVQNKKLSKLEEEKNRLLQEAEDKILQISEKNKKRIMLDIESFKSLSHKKIRRTEEEAVKSVQKVLTEISLKAAEKVINNALDKDSLNEFQRNSIKNLKSELNLKN